MRNFIMILLVAAFGMTVTACGEKVEVPPAHAGKILTKDGFEPDIIPPSKFRLPWCMRFCPKLMLVEAGDTPIKETMQVFMPHDELNMDFDVRMTVSVNALNEKAVNTIFSRIGAEKTREHDAHGIVTVSKVYQTYAQPVIRDVARQVVANYRIANIAEERATINAELDKEIRSALEGTPIQILRIGIADVQYPTVIIDAKEAAKKREVEIQREEAQREIELVQATTQLEVAKKDREVRLLKAQTIRDENKIVSESVTPEYLEYRRLEVMEEMATNESAVFVPYDAVGDIGLNNRIYRQGQ